MLGFDAAHSIFAAGWVAESSYSPADVLNALYSITPDQGPLYFLLLNQWGYLVGHEIAVARVLAIFCGLMSLAMMYRLGRDAVSPVAGTFAVIVLASNAFFGFYYAHVRFYPLLVLLSTIVIWLYLRIAVVERAPKRRDYVALICACAALVSTHAFGFLLYIVCALYHLLLVRKNGRWLAVVVAAVAALIVASPIISVMLTKGVDFAVAGHGPRADGLGEIYAAWLNVTANGSPLVVVLTAGGAAIAWHQKTVALERTTLQFFVLLLLGIALASFFTRILDVGLMRHLSAGIPIAVLFQAAALNALYRKRKPFGVLVCLWAIAGILFAGSADWSLYIQGRIDSYQLPPWHLISRVAQQTDDQAHIIAYPLSKKLTTPYPWTTVSLHTRWFVQRDIEFQPVSSSEQIESYLRRDVDPGEPFWLVYQRSVIEATKLTEIEAVMDELGYQACRTVRLPTTTEMVSYRWISFDCEPPAPVILSATDTIDYELFGTALDSASSRLFFSDRWTAKVESLADKLNMSFQLIGDEWDNVAQLDLPLVNAGELRQFWIDVAAVPAGRYRLMVVVYDSYSGERQDWVENEGTVAAMLQLAEIEIP